MKAILQITALTFIFSFCVHPQAPNTLWSKPFGGLNNEVCLSFELTEANEIVVSGTISPAADIMLLKISEAGNVLWQKTYPTVYDDAASHLAPTKDGGYILTGYRYIFGTLLWKFDSYGDTIWTKRMIQGEQTRGNCVVQHTDGGYLIAGKWEGIQGAPLIMKYNDIGIMQWTEGYGGTWYGSFNSIIKTSDNNYVAVGSAGNIPNSLYLIKINPDGDLIWEKAFRNYNSTHGAIGECVQETTDGGFIITGFEDFNIPSHSTWLIKTDSNGDSLWTKILFGDGGEAVKQTQDEGYIVVSNQAGNGVLNKTDKDGNLMWTKTISENNEDYFTSVGQCSDAGFVVGGYSNSFGAGDFDIWLVKTQPDVSEVRIEGQSSKYYKLFSNYPNPFNPSTRITYTIPERSNVSLKIFNLLGGEIVELVNEEKSPGKYELYWNAADLPSGVYFYRIQAGDFIDTNKMVLIK